MEILLYFFPKVCRMDIEKFLSQNNSKIKMVTCKYLQKVIYLFLDIGNRDLDSFIGGISSVKEDWIVEEMLQECQKKM